MKDGSSLVVTPSSIPSFATRGPNADLSSKGSKDVLEDPDDEPTMKKKISDFDEEENVDPETEFMGMCLFPPFLFCYLPYSFFLSSPLYTYVFGHPFAAVSLYLYAYFSICRDL